jgi:hypothetical protein
MLSRRQMCRDSSDRPGPASAGLCIDRPFGRLPPVEFPPPGIALEAPACLARRLLESRGPSIRGAADCLGAHEQTWCDSSYQGGKTISVAGSPRSADVGRWP